MKDKDGSIVGPAEFIDMASATGAVSILGEQVFAKVCEFIRDGGHIDELGRSHDGPVLVLHAHKCFSAFHTTGGRFHKRLQEHFQRSTV